MNNNENVTFGLTLSDGEQHPQNKMSVGRTQAQGATPRTHAAIRAQQVSPDIKRETGIFFKDNCSVLRERGAALITSEARPKPLGASPVPSAPAIGTPEILGDPKATTPQAGDPAPAAQTHTSAKSFDLASYDGDNDDVDNEYVCDEREQSTSALSDEWELEPENRDALLLNLRDIESQFPASHSEETEWTQRKQVLEENWTSARNDLFDAFLSTKSIPESAMCCTKCKENVAVIRCTECRKMLCSSCDETEHIIFPFHDRDTWINGFYEPVGNLVTINEGEIVLIDRPLPVSYPSLCPASSTCNIEQRYTKSRIKIITMKGRYEFNEAYFFCTNCSLIISGCTVRSMLIAGYLPASPQRATTFFSLDLLRFWDSLSMNSPGTSLSSFVRSLENVSKMSGRVSIVPFPLLYKFLKMECTNFLFAELIYIFDIAMDFMAEIRINFFQQSSINSTAFSKWKFVSSNIKFQNGNDDFVCPVCSDVCHSIHIDCLQQPSDYEDDKMCQSSYWKAARSKSSKSYATLDETGLVVAGCRHVLALKGVNMFAGEQYGYALFLHQLLFGEVRMARHNV
ncbi:uncharacterized protein LOC135693656 [Rhopilema esculentum]|uniref:uncharacterized protein LOC135693656 n=1 Tax=Rhopilema esculentum TaxID=499914 RepID=UPI0031D8566C